MSSLLRIIGYLLGAFALALVIFFALLAWGLNVLQREIVELLTGAPAERSTADVAQADRIRFLSDVDFDAGPVRVILEPSITGGETLVIDDQTLLRQTAADASIPQLGLGGRLTLIDALFGSDGRMARVPALRVYQNGYLSHVDYCLGRLCHDDALTRSSLAPLLEGASGRLIGHSESYTDHDAYAAAFRAAKSAPGLMTPLPLEPTPKSRRPISFTITLPSIELPLVEPPTQDMRQEVWDYDYLLGTAIEDWIRGDISVNGSDSWQVGGVSIYDGCSGDDSRLAVLGDNTIIITMKAVGDTSQYAYDRLAATTDWSFLPLRPTPRLPAALQARITAGTLAPECLRLWQADGPPLMGPIIVSPPEYEQYYLQWEEVVALDTEPTPASP